MNPWSVEEPSAGRILTVCNRQRDCRIDSACLRRLVRYHLETQLGLTSYNLGVHLLSARRMAMANEQHLAHTGPTDVITFDYSEPGGDRLWGELLVCPAVARQQAVDYATTWQSELLRYIVHGLLHLRGHDDRTTAARRVMKRQEDRLLRALAHAQALEMVGPPGAARKRTRTGLRARGRSG
jgi:rRNA maturation RNase YbeY